MNFRRNVLVNTAVAVCQVLLLVPMLMIAARAAENNLPRSDAAQETQQSHPQPPKPEEKGRAAATIKYRGELIYIVADQFEQSGSTYMLHGDAQIDFRNYVLYGDEISYNQDSGEAIATGHVKLQGGEYDVHMEGTRAEYNVTEGTGKFYDVHGTTGLKLGSHRAILTTSNPFTFSGKQVDKVGPNRFTIHHGSITSCELPHPKWTFSADTVNFEVGELAKLYHSTFRLFSIPILYLPFAEHPVEKVGRQSGFLIPSFGQSSVKGTIVGDSYFWAINRSMDATIGLEYFSKRGFAQHANFRALTSANSFISATYFGVIDRGLGPTHIDQGGEDVHLYAEQYFPQNVRAVANIEYLSSYLFRQAFAENFTTAVNSEVKSDVFATRDYDGFSLGALAQRYQNFQSTNKGDSFSILHVPSIDASSVDRSLFGSPFLFGFDAEASGLSRRSPTFSSANLVARLDAYPHLTLPLFLRGWTLRPLISVRDTYYTQHKSPETPLSIGTTVNDPLNRKDFEGELEMRPPRVEKIYQKGIFGKPLKHTIEPRITYRYVGGINNFLNVIRFDSTDIVSNTNEVEYALTNRIYLKPRNQRCDEANPDVPCSRTPTELLSWEVAQKYFIDPYFGGALVPGVRNVLQTTAEFTGIAFLTEPRVFSPVTSRLHIRTTHNTDLQWLLDYDSKKGQINASNVFFDYRLGPYFLGGSHALLHAPGEVFLSNPLPTVQKFNQFRVTSGFGNPSRRGFSLAGNVGYDLNLTSLQYTAIQTSYNWDCCGLNFEYRRFVLGPVRNESQYRFAFSLANIGTFGNLRRQERVF
ncbi:MAG TPA: LPS assembly protein LptD [Terriglobales bacterium]|nr:LPS assembly protein LptD [Terriglobales bacterium]